MKPTVLHVAALMAAGLAHPVHADTLAADASHVACKDLMAMDKRGQITVAMATKEAMEADVKIQSMSDEDILRISAKACAAHPEALVVEALKKR